MVRFVIHHLIKIMQIHCCSVKWWEIFGRENTHFFCPNASGGKRSRFPVSLQGGWWDGTACCLTAHVALLVPHTAHISILVSINFSKPPKWGSYDPVSRVGAIKRWPKITGLPWCWVGGIPSGLLLLLMFLVRELKWSQLIWSFFPRLLSATSFRNQTWAHSFLSS